MRRKEEGELRQTPRRSLHTEKNANKAAIALYLTLKEWVSAVQPKGERSVKGWDN